MQAREVLMSEEKRRAYDAEMSATASGMYAEADPWQSSLGTPGRRPSGGGNAGSPFEHMFHV